jgi:hypothetical protein
MRIWTRVFVMVAGTMTACGLAATTVEAQAVAYGVAGPAGFSGFYGTSGLNGHVAGGAEVLAGGRVGGQGEFGAIGGSGGLLFVTSANGIARFGSSSERVSPFVTGGYTRMFSGEGSFNAWNAGAGADIWLRPRVGLRLEFRDHVRPDSRGAVHYWTFRAGVAFR